MGFTIDQRDLFREFGYIARHIQSTFAVTDNGNLTPGRL